MEVGPIPFKSIVSSDGHSIRRRRRRRRAMHTNNDGCTVHVWLLCVLIKTSLRTGARDPVQRAPYTRARRSNFQSSQLVHGSQCRRHGVGRNRWRHVGFDDVTGRRFRWSQIGGASSISAVRNVNTSSTSQWLVNPLHIVSRKWKRPTALTVYRILHCYIFATNITT